MPIIVRDRRPAPRPADDPDRAGGTGRYHPCQPLILKTGKAKAMRFSTLEAICEVLECQPGDLLGYQAD